MLSACSGNEKRFIKSIFNSKVDGNYPLEEMSKIDRDKDKIEKNYLCRRRKNIVFKDGKE